MDRYEDMKIIGRGNYGTAFAAKDRITGSKIVVKKIPLFSLSDKERRDAESECKILATLRHPNVVEFIDSFLEDHALHLVTQYCELGDLARVIKKNKKKGRYFEEEQIVDWFIQIAMAVDHIHSKNIMHRDLKTANVFLTRTMVIKLGDFGIAKVLDSTLEQANTVVGTPYYMSPEVCENKKYDKKSDLWAMGCILYELCTLNHAFDASNLLGLVFKIVQESYPPIPDHYSEELRELIDQLLSKDPNHRPSCRRIFRFPFIKRRLEQLAKSASLGHAPLELATNKNSASSSSFDGTIVLEGSSDGCLTPVQRVRERKQHASKLREVELREAAVNGKQNRLEAKRRSIHMFQTSADNKMVPADDDSCTQLDLSNLSLVPPPPSSLDFEPMSPPPPPPPFSSSSASRRESKFSEIDRRKGAASLKQQNADTAFLRSRSKSYSVDALGHSAFREPRQRSVTCDENSDASSLDSLPFDERPIRSSGSYHVVTKKPEGNIDEYSDDFESDGSEETALKTPARYSEKVRAADEMDERNILNECRKLMEDDSKSKFNHQLSSHSSNISNIDTPIHAPDWQAIASNQKERLKRVLGEPLFKQVYYFLKGLHSKGGESSTSKQNTKHLTRMVGDKDRLSVCFDIDQLIYIEETYLSS